MNARELGQSYHRVKRSFMTGAEAAEFCPVDSR